MGLFDFVAEMTETLERVNQNIKTQDSFLKSIEQRERLFSHCLEDKTLIIANIKNERKGYINLAQTPLKNTQTAKLMFYLLKTYQENKKWIGDIVEVYAHQSSSKSAFFAQKELRNLGGIASRVKILVRESEVSSLETIFSLRNTQDIRLKYAKMIADMLKLYIKQEIEGLRARINKRILKYKEKQKIKHSFENLLRQIVLFRLTQAQKIVQKPIRKKHKE